MQHVHTLTRDAKSGVLVFFEGGGGSRVSSVGGVVVDLVSTSVFIGIGRDWIVDSMQKVFFGGFVDTTYCIVTKFSSIHLGYKWARFGDREL